jgi:hypothetical protein
MNKRQKDILTVVVALVLVGGFLFLAEGLRKDKNDNARLAAIDNTTTSTTFEETTTTTFPEITTIPPIILTTTSTTVRTATTVKTTPTTKKTTGGTTATTKKPTATTTSAPRPNPPFNGAGQETSDNSAQFTLPSTASPAVNTSETDPLSFLIQIVPKGANSADIVVKLRNNTGRTISFPGGLKITVTVAQQGAESQTFVLASASQTTLEGNGFGLTISSSGATILGSGTFTATAVMPVDYGS